MRLGADPGQGSKMTMNRFWNIRGKGPRGTDLHFMKEGSTRENALDAYARDLDWNSYAEMESALLPSEKLVATLHCPAGPNPLRDHRRDAEKLMAASSSAAEIATEACPIGKSLASGRAEQAKRKTATIDLRDHWTRAIRATSAPDALAELAHASLAAIEAHGSDVYERRAIQMVEDAATRSESSPKSKSTFKDIGVGERFNFASEREFSGRRGTPEVIGGGPWVKIGDRRYVHESGSPEHKVGSTSAEVEIDVHPLVKDGTIYTDGREYIGIASDGTKVSIGSVGDEAQMYRYLYAHPSPSDW